MSEKRIKLSDKKLKNVNGGIDLDLLNFEHETQNFNHSLNREKYSKEDC